LILDGQTGYSTYNAANQQLVFGSYRMLYDAAGNVTNIVSGTTTNRLLWSARNQLTNMLGAVSATFRYDGLGRRQLRTVNTVTENYLYDGLDIIVQKDGSGNVRGRYLRGLAIDEPWQRIDITPAGGNQTTTTNRIYLAEALGSIVALTDTGKVITTEYDYEPFGATATTGAGNKNAYKFTAREDDGTGLYYYRARYYHPALGRFISEDPSKSTGLEAYWCADNNPLIYLDPLGLFSFYRWLYTGDGNASDEVYAAALDAAGRWAYDCGWVRGYYGAVGPTGKFGKRKGSTLDN
jgi:RHS repeat-associated protein